MFSIHKHTYVRLFPSSYAHSLTWKVHERYMCFCCYITTQQQPAGRRQHNSIRSGLEKTGNTGTILILLLHALLVRTPCYILQYSIMDIHCKCLATYCNTLLPCYIPLCKCTLENALKIPSIALIHKNAS